MQVIISGHKIDVGATLSSYIEDNLKSNVQKYFKEAIKAQVILSSQNHNSIKCEIILNEGTGLQVVAADLDTDAYEAFNRATRKLQAQLRKHKSRLKDHHKPAHYLEATNYIIQPFEEEEEDSKGLFPVIVAEKVSKIDKLTVEEAVTKLDLLDLRVLVFMNSSTEKLNLVYYRNDGNIAWLEIPSMASNKDK